MRLFLFDTRMGESREESVYVHSIQRQVQSDDGDTDIFI